MRPNFPSRDELSAMPLSRLRGLDIHELDEEELVQEIVQAKLRNMPPEGKVYRGDVPDIKTPEQEAQWQKVIDGRNAEKKAKIVGTIPEPVKPVVEPTIEVPPPNEPTTESEPTTCKICNAKKGHKKACPNK